MRKLQAKGQVSVLTSSAFAGGTIAAVRCLGANGYDVGILYNSPLAAAAWSRYAARVYRTPHETNTEAFLESLMRIGGARHGQVLLASSDETAWLYAEHAATLSSRFVVYQPPIETIRRILDKGALTAAANKVAITTPPIWESSDGSGFEELCFTLPYPILIKPRTHIQRVNNDKGVIVNTPGELAVELEAFLRRENRLGPDGSISGPIKRPLLQRFVQGGPGAISITGFIDRTGEHFVTRRCVKVLQRLKATGVGVCFEALPPDNELSESVRRLCRELGYFGLFEAEFLWMDGRWALIDFNPRLFNQVALDIRREMPLPLLACLDAVGDSSGLREAVARAQAYDQLQPAAIWDGFTVRAILFAKALRGSTGSAEREKWRAWMKKTAPQAIDFTADRQDWAPAVVHAISETYLGLRAIPRFLRTEPRAATSARAVAAERTT